MQVQLVFEIVESDDFISIVCLSPLSSTWKLQFDLPVLVCSIIWPLLYMSSASKAKSIGIAVSKKSILKETVLILGYLRLTMDKLLIYR